MIVVDASVLAPAVLDDGTAGLAARAALQAERHAHAPDLVYLEVMSFIRRATRSGSADSQRAMRAVMRLTTHPLVVASHLELLRVIWTLRDRCSSYDAAYVALAITLDAPLLTADRRLAAAASGLCDIRLVASSD